MISALSICGYSVVFGLVMYVILDGFTVGIGMMLPWLDRDNQNMNISAILPTWDGNQTWLVFVVAALYGAFPVAFGTLLPHWYLPLFIVAMVLLLRGISFEFRMKNPQHAPVWDSVVGVASLLIPGAQAYLITDWMGAHPGQCLYPMIVLMLVLLSSYWSLGSCRMLFKCREAQLPTFQMLARKGLIAMLLTHVLWLLIVPTVPALQGLSMLTLLIAGAVVAALVLVNMKLVERGSTVLPYWLVILTMAVQVVVVLLEVHGMAIPFLNMTAEQAAAPEVTLQFMAPGLLVILPLVLVYTSASYWAFRGRIREDVSY